MSIRQDLLMRQDSLLQVVLQDLLMRQGRLLQVVLQDLLMRLDRLLQFERQDRLIFKLQHLISGEPLTQQLLGEAFCRHPSLNPHGIPGMKRTSLSAGMDRCQLIQLGISLLSR